MKKIISLAIFFALLGSFYLYIEIDKRNFVNNLPQPPVLVEQPINNRPVHQNLEETTMPNIQKTTTSSKTEGSDLEQEGSVVREKGISDYDWRTDVEHPHEHLPITDPWGNLLKEDQAKKRGTWIGDPETMDPDELYSAEYNQLLEKFGDIPQVHTVMEYERKFANNIPLTLEEKIIGLKAQHYLFPSESTRKTIDYYKWQQSKGGVDALKRIKPEDIEYLQSLGIEVKKEKVGTHTQITISTK
ncbi:MAG: hypothetical protein OXN25_01145 [Candidatus Poribacteria bacterium]|nr:hypothetical protein [Candidatus Poribacteria bacterium]